MPPRPRFDRRAPVRELPNINERIKYPKLRVVDADGSQLGIITREEALDIARDTIKIGAKVLWLQLGIKNEQAKKLVIKNKIEYIEDRCTKMEYQKHFLKIRQAFPVLQD